MQKNPNLSKTKCTIEIPLKKTLILMSIFWSYIKRRYLVWKPYWIISRLVDCFQTTPLSIYILLYIYIAIEAIQALQSLQIGTLISTRTARCRGAEMRQFTMIVQTSFISYY